MNILIIGSESFASYESSCARYLRKAGCEVEIWDSKACFRPFIGASWWHMGRITRSIYNTAASIAFIRKATSLRPDVLFMPKAENIHSWCVKEVKKITGARLVVWYPDNPFRAENTSMNILRNLEHVDVFYIWGRFLIDSLISAGCRNVKYLPFGFDPELHDLTDTPVDRDIPCLHVGSYSEEKRDALLCLADSGLQIYGPGWETEVSIRGPMATCVKGDGLFGRDMVEAYRRAVVVANPIRLQNMPAHNLRTIEAAGIGGGVVLTQRTREQAEELFHEGHHILCYGTQEEMVNKVRWALANRNAASEVAKRAREHVFAMHLLEHRINQILADLQISYRNHT
jgi:spore maturation protein CgeB